MGLPEFYKKSQDDSFFQILLKSFLIVLLLALSVLGFRFFFNWLAFESFDKAEAFQKLRSSKEAEKLMIAQEWLHKLQAETPGWGPDNAESAFMIAELESIPPRAEFENPAKATALVSLLAYSEEKKLIRPRILNILKSLESQEKYLSFKIMGLLSLSRLGPLESPEEKEFFLKAADHHDVSVRKIFAFSSAHLLKEAGDYQESIKNKLFEKLSDEVEEVRWNAAFSLASIGDQRAVSIIDTLLDRVQNAGQKNQEAVTAENYKLFEEVLRAAVSLKEMKLRDKVYKISREHPHLKLRQAAKNFVEK